VDEPAFIKIFPLCAVSLPPLEIYKAPPVWVVPAPALIDTSPPTPVAESPTDNSILPELLAEDDPDVRVSEDELDPP